MAAGYQPQTATKQADLAIQKLEIWSRLMTPQIILKLYPRRFGGTYCI